MELSRTARVGVGLPNFIKIVRAVIRETCLINYRAGIPFITTPDIANLKVRTVLIRAAIFKD